jgi:quercetin dioxygenase-like cupin family protein
MPTARPRRVVTGHDSTGRSVVLADSPAPKSHAIPGATFHEIWNTTAMPAPVRPSEPREPTDRPLVTPPDPNGTIIRVVDLGPRSVSPMHRTESIDYGIVLAGEVHLVLDDGSETVLRPGDIVVQRGTDHAWENRAGEPARMVFILVDGSFSDELRRIVPAEALEHLFSAPLDREPDA